jgi:hypothetical protein
LIYRDIGRCRYATPSRNITNDPAASPEPGDRAVAPGGRRSHGGRRPRSTQTSAVECAVRAASGPSIRRQRTSRPGRPGRCGTARGCPAGCRPSADGLADAGVGESVAQPASGEAGRRLTAFGARRRNARTPRASGFSAKAPKASPVAGGDGAGGGGCRGDGVEGRPEHRHDADGIHDTCGLRRRRSLRRHDGAGSSSQLTPDVAPETTRRGQPPSAGRSGLSAVRGTSAASARRTYRARMCLGAGADLVSVARRRRVRLPAPPCAWRGSWPPTRWPACAGCYMLSHCGCGFLEASSGIPDSRHPVRVAGLASRKQPLMVHRADCFDFTAVTFQNSVFYRLCRH